MEKSIGKFIRGSESFHGCVLVSATETKTQSVFCQFSGGLKGSLIGIQPQAFWDWVSQFPESQTFTVTGVFNSGYFNINKIAVSDDTAITAEKPRFTRRPNPDSAPSGISPTLEV